MFDLDEFAGLLNLNLVLIHNKRLVTNVLRERERAKLTLLVFVHSYPNWTILRNFQRISQRIFSPNDKLSAKYAMYMEKFWGVRIIRCETIH